LIPDAVYQYFFIFRILCNPLLFIFFMALQFSGKPALRKRYPAAGYRAFKGVYKILKSLADHRMFKSVWLCIIIMLLCKIHIFRVSCMESAKKTIPSDDPLLYYIHFSILNITSYP